MSCGAYLTSLCLHIQIDQHGWHAAAGGINSLASGIQPAAGWGLETILTATLVFVVFCATDAERGADTTHLPVRVQHGPLPQACHKHVSMLRNAM